MSEKINTNENVVNKINKFRGKSCCNESLAAILRDKIKKRAKIEPGPKNYYYIVDLCNPVNTYWSHKEPETKKSAELTRKLAWGKHLHNFSTIWFQELPNFVFEEGKVDGIFVNIPGVRGSIDYYMGESILELKTKKKLPENDEEVLSLYPQDLEQLIFYSVIHPSHPKINFLIFMEDSSPYKFKVFKIVIRDFNKMRSLLIQRRDSLTKAIEQKDPSKLGRCRYYQNRCPFGEKELCNCASLEPISLEHIKDSIEISFDKDLTKKLEEIKETKGSPNSLFSPYNILAPRKYYGQKIKNIDFQWTKDPKNEEYWACLNFFIKELPLDLTPLDKENIPKTKREQRLRIPYRWARLKTSINPEGDVIPYLIKVSGAKDKKFTLDPFDYWTAELGIIASTHGKTKGIIFAVYPNINDFVQVFEVTYNKPNEILKEVRKIIDNLEKDPIELNLLPPCPEYMNNKKSCPLMHDCHIEPYGCVPGYISSPKS